MKYVDESECCIGCTKIWAVGPVNDIRGLAVRQSQREQQKHSQTEETEDTERTCATTGDASGRAACFFSFRVCKRPTQNFCVDFGSTQGSGGGGDLGERRAE
jgi:hypothetical protein